MIEILSAPPYLSIQDTGRPGYRAAGVPISGAMDRPSLATANRVAGNTTDTAALEWSLAGGTIRFAHPTHFALAGATVEATLDGAPIAADHRHAAHTGAVLHVARFTAGRFVYLAVHGGIDVPPVMGSRATYLPARLGGHHGRLLRSGDQLPIGIVTDPHTSPSTPEYRTSAGMDTVRIVRGPNARRVDDAGWATLFTSSFIVNAASDRIGYRLDGPPLGGAGWGTLPSAPMRPGIVQLTEGGTLIVLMPDGPTVGGYPAIAAVVSADLAVLAQRCPGDSVRFREITIAEAENIARRAMDQFAKRTPR